MRGAPILRAKNIRALIIVLLALAILVGAMLFGIQGYMERATRDFLLTEAAQAPTADAIMVLGAKVYADGRPSLVLVDRLEYAIELYTLGKAPRILVSGDHGQTEYDEVKVMRNYLVDRGIPIEDVFMDHAGFNTYDSMYRARDVFGIERLLVCTQRFHITRAVYIARALGIDAYGYPSEDRPVFRMAWNNFRERLARVKAFFDVMRARPPRYLGEPISLSGSGLVTED